MATNGTALEPFVELLAELRAKADEQRVKLEEIEHEMALVQGAIETYRKHKGATLPMFPSLVIPSDNSTITEKRRQALISLAEANKGVLVYADARQALVQAGLYRDAKQFRQQAGSLIERMDCWERVKNKRGRYKLIKKVA